MSFTPGPKLHFSSEGEGSWRVVPCSVQTHHRRFCTADWDQVTCVQCLHVALAGFSDMYAALAEAADAVACQCDEAYTSRNRHEFNALCYLESVFRAVLAKARGEA